MIFHDQVRTHSFDGSTQIQDPWNLNDCTISPNTGPFLPFTRFCAEKSSGLYRNATPRLLTHCQYIGVGELSGSDFPHSNSRTCIIRILRWMGFFSEQIVSFARTDVYIDS